MRRAGLVIVPVNMHHAPVPVRVRMTGENGNATQGRVERIIAGMVVVIEVFMIVAVRVFHEAGRVGVIVLTAPERNSDFEAVWLRYLIQRFPVVSPIGKGERLASAVGPDSFDAHPIDGRPGEAEARRDAVLEDRQLGHAVAGVDAS